MTRQEAEKLIGTKVWVWTASNGTYVGVLEEVLPRRPWRGRVRITGVLTPAQGFEIGRPITRRGFCPGEAIEVGGINVKPTTEEGTDYQTALARDLDRLLALRKDGKGSPHAWAIDKAIEVREKQVSKGHAKN